MGCFKNSERLDLSLIDANAIKGLIKVRKEGDSKHGPYNWATGSRTDMQHFEAIIRHLYRWLRGEDQDKDSGQHPMYHVMCRAMFIAANPQHQDDRKDAPINADSRQG